MHYTYTTPTMAQRKNLERRYMADNPKSLAGHYRKKPVVIEAMQLTSNDALAAAITWCGGRPWMVDMEPGVQIKTLEGIMYASPGDWIIKGVKGEFYPCKPDIFEATYEPAAALRAPTIAADDGERDIALLRILAPIISENCIEDDDDFEVWLDHEPGFPFTDCHKCGGDVSTPRQWLKHRCEGEKDG
jgi:hypothetical protein